MPGKIMLTFGPPSMARSCLSYRPARDRARMAGAPRDGPAVKIPEESSNHPGPAEHYTPETIGRRGAETVTMARRGEVLRGFRTLFEAGAISGLSDAELLDRSADRSAATAELAFAALVERHGPMVLR